MQLVVPSKSLEHCGSVGAYTASMGALDRDGLGLAYSGANFFHISLLT